MCQGTQIAGARHLHKMRLLDADSKTMPCMQFAEKVCVSLNRCAVEGCLVRARARKSLTPDQPQGGGAQTSAGDEMLRRAMKSMCRMHTAWARARVVFESD